MKKVLSWLLCLVMTVSAMCIALPVSCNAVVINPGEEQEENGESYFEQLKDILTLKELFEKEGGYIAENFQQSITLGFMSILFTGFYNIMFIPALVVIEVLNLNSGIINMAE